MIWSKVSELPQLSVAVHVLVITEALAQVPAIVASVDVTFNPADPQVVVAVAAPVFAGKLDSSHSIVELLG